MNRYNQPSSRPGSNNGNRNDASYYGSTSYAHLERAGGGDRSNYGYNDLNSAAYGAKDAYHTPSSSNSNSTPKEDEVHRLMHTLGLSKTDMELLSQLPESELSVGNLAKAINDLKHNPKDGSSPSGSRNVPDTRFPKGSTTGGRKDYQHETRYSYKDDNKNDGILGARPPVKGYDSREPGKPSGLSSPPFNNDRRSDSRSSRDNYDDQSTRYQGNDSGGRFERSRDTSRGYSPRRKSTDRYDNRRDDQQRSRGPVGSIRGGSKDLPPRPRGSHPSPHDKLPPRPRGSVGLLGNPDRPSPRGLDDLASAVGGSRRNQSRSSLGDSLLVADPAVLEAQIQAMRVLQAEAIKLKQNIAPEPRDSRRERPPPPARRESTENSKARRAAEEMRRKRGRVLYMRYKSNRITEDDLKDLASAFGKVSGILTIRAKVLNGFNQAFMELEQWDCAAAMLERFIIRPPMVKGCEILVDRSNYTDLQIRYKKNQGRGMRGRSISPIRPSKSKRGRTRSKSPRRSSPSIKRSRPGSKQSSDSKASDDKDKISVSVSSSNKRVVRKRDESRSSRWSKDDTIKSKSPSSSSDTKRERTKTETSEHSKSGDGKGKDEDDPLDAIADEIAANEDFVLMDAVSQKADESNNDQFEVENESLENVDVEIKDNATNEDEKPMEENAVEEEFNIHSPIAHDIGILDEEVDGEEERKDEEAPASESQTEDQQENDVLNGEKADYDTKSTNDSSVADDDPDKPDEHNTVDDGEKDKLISEQELKLTQLKEAIRNALADVEQANDHLTALLKTTKSKAAAAVAKKLRASLDDASLNLRGCDDEDEEEEESVVEVQEEE